MQNRNGLLFLDNGTSHQKSIEKRLSNIRLVFLPKNTTSRFQHLDAGIIRDFKLKYLKFLIFLTVTFLHIIPRVDDDKQASGR